MAITALSNASPLQYVSSSSDLNIIQTSLQSLQRSLGTGNLAGAQTAFNQLQKASQNLSDVGGTSAPSAQTTAGLATLGSALAKGDLAGAKTAATAVQSDLANVNSLAITAAVASANQVVQQIDALLGLAGGDASSTSSSLNSLFGASSATPDIAAQTTALLSTVYGNHSTAASDSSSASSTKINVSA